MKALKEPLKELAEYNEASDCLKNGIYPILMSGCVDTEKCQLMDAFGEGSRYKVIITYSENKAKEIYEDLKLYSSDVYLYPAKDVIFYSADVHGYATVKERMKVMRNLLEEKPCTIITTLESGMEHLIPLSHYKAHTLEFKKDEDIELDNLRKELAAIGYEYRDQVETVGEYSIRGGIVDVFPLTEEIPYRIELWGDTVSSIHSFDVESQRSIEEVDELTLYSATEVIAEEDRIAAGLAEIEKDAAKQADIFMKDGKVVESLRIKEAVRELKQNIEYYKGMAGLESYISYFYKDARSFYDFFPENDTIYYIDEPARTYEHGEAIYYEFEESMKMRLEKGYILPAQMEVLYHGKEIYGKLASKKLVMFSALDNKVKEIRAKETFSLSVQAIASYNGNFSLMVNDLQRWKKNNYRVLILSPSRTRAMRLSENLREEDINAFYSDDGERILKSGEIMTAYGQLHKGFEYPQIKFAVLSEEDIFGDKKVHKKKKRYNGQSIRSFSELSIGDYVVHESHGLGIYRGIEKIEVDKVIKDYLKIEYAKDGVLYIPATGLEVLQKYANATDSEKKPKLNSLNSNEWKKTKARVRMEVKDIAEDLVGLYAARQAKKGYTYSPDTIWQQEFEEMFPYDETQDQLNAIEDTKKDMESSKIMDRLICGDVGYGKTEIAIRAAFKAVSDGKQVAYLVPTTVLAQQHYNTFVQRMKDFPVNVDMLSRFRTPTQIKKALEKLKKGQLDIVVGTHRLLSKDVQFKDLGLLIIDEEQRFGVAHKEKIKQLKENIDVLSLSATPIPRTLHMSLIGIRDMSVLEEPPMDRLPIQTYVLEHNDEIVREAISRELSRGGQVYYVHNRVNNIDAVAAVISKLVPEANVVYAHGQMSERQLERIMFDFIHGDIDVLVSTTIIETGLDISNVNTIIIDEADRLGLSQLYQLRGRVGRSNRTAYAFLMYKRDRMLKEAAEKRLAAIREFTELGSGFKIAMRDLEIRGAGNLLGAKQHGHIAAVGYDMYCKMLNEAVMALKGEKAEISDEFETSVEMEVDAYIPASYIKSEALKLEMYKRIADIENEEERNDRQDELRDRFGPYPESVNNLMEIALIKAMAHEVYVTSVVYKKDKSHLRDKKPRDIIRFKLYENAPFDIIKIPSFMEGEGKRLTFVKEGKPEFVYWLRDGEDLFEKIKALLLKMKMLVRVEGDQNDKSDQNDGKKVK